jgi:4-hydroxy-2-oxoheptanedioate aldolase
MYPNPLKEKMKKGELVLGCSLDEASPGVVTATCAADIDFLWMDTEHRPYGTEALAMLPIIARRAGVAPLIRVAWNDPALIKKAYDVGAVAVMVPQINNAEEAAKAVEYARYPPLGERGVAPNWPRLAGEDYTKVVTTANEETVLILQIESKRAYDNLDEILKVPGFDGLFLGPMDMSASLGVIGQLDAPELIEVWSGLGERLKGTGIAAATLLNSLSMDEARMKIGWGYNFFSMSSPLSWGVKTLNENIASLR